LDPPRDTGRVDFRAVSAEARTLSDVRLYSVSTSNLAEDAYRALEAILDADERERANRFRWPSDRHAYVAAHALLRYALSAVAGASADSWRFHADPFGKPRLAPDTAVPGLEFSLSHTRGKALVGVGKDMQLGVDVERADPDKPFLEVAEHCFHAREVAYLRQETANPERCARFTTVWTVKEAFLKALGTGMSQALDSFAVDPRGSGALIFADPALGAPDAWHVCARARDGYHWACLVRPSDGRKVRIAHDEMHYTRPDGWRILERIQDPSAGTR
jgi:4'-phosphopantetheinyl transferase